MLDEMSTEDAIFSKNRIYRKAINLDDSYSMYVLMKLNNIFVWEKTDEMNKESNDYKLIPFNDLSCQNDNNQYITIYRLKNGFSTEMMIYNGENSFSWEKMAIHLDDRNMNTISLLDISTHIDLTKEFTDNYPFLNDYEFTEYPNENLPDNITAENKPEQDNKSVENNVENHVENNVENHVEDKEGYNPDDLFKWGPFDETDISFERDNSEILYPHELRPDPYDNKRYTKAEFFEYYGNLDIWNHQSPTKILLRNEYLKFENQYSHLETDKFIFLFNKYEKTF